MSCNLLGKISKVTNGDDFVKYGYNADGYVASASFNDDAYMYIDYNYLNLPTLIKYETADGTRSSTSYDYTLNGNLRMKSINSGESGSFYYYDDAGRLAIENTWGDNIDYDDIFTYDKLGNRLTSTHNDHITDQTVTTSYTYNNLNQLVSSACGDDTTTYSYDALGNMTSVASNGITTKSYSYDDFGRLSQATFGDVISQYSYNGDNLRQTKTVNGVQTTHIYDGSDIVADISDTTKVFVSGIY